jgi:sterol desaturase/sphingolipid hydroxylase (fatty acid hydroxylase superfamily)
MPPIDTAGAAKLVGTALSKLFFNPASAISLSSLACALVIATAAIAVRRWKKNRALRLLVIARALFPERIWSSPSVKSDLFYFFLNTLVTGALIGWAIVSFTTISNAVIGGLIAIFGVVTPALVPPSLTTQVVITLALFLAYEMGYWVDHYISHKVSWLWEFHKVHHSAEVLTPLTVFRVHPVESLKFANILALFVGVTNGTIGYLYGETSYAFTVSGANVILVAFMHLFIHLQHSHIWIAFTGPAGRVVLSPAHHQIHHSSDPVHYDKNFGSCLAVWDWVFGTLFIPSKEPTKLHFGVDKGPVDHSIVDTLFMPFVNATRPILPVGVADGAAAALKRMKVPMTANLNSQPATPGAAKT